jgi:hypothetical protein
MKVRTVWPQVTDHAETTLVLSDRGSLGVLCESDAVANELTTDSRRLAAEINEACRFPGLVAEVRAVAASEAERLLAVVLNEALDRIHDLESGLRQ